MSGRIKRPVNIGNGKGARIMQSLNKEELIQALQEEEGLIDSIGVFHNESLVPGEMRLICGSKAHKIFGATVGKETPAKPKIEAQYQKEKFETLEFKFLKSVLRFSNRMKEASEELQEATLKIKNILEGNNADKKDGKS
jgi:hypothetical protein